MKKQVFPSITTVAVDAWHAISGKLLQLIGLSFASSFISFVILSTGVALTFMFSALQLDFSLFSTFRANPQAGAQFVQSVLDKWPVLSVGFGITMVVITIIGLLAQIVLIRLLADKKQVSIESLIRQGVSLLLPLFLTQLLVMVLSTGGMFVLFVPGLIVSLLLSFAQYELILERVGVITSLKNSIKIVSSHLGTILLYMLVFWFSYIIIFYFVPNTIAKVDESSGLMVMMLRFVANVLIGWFGAAFNIQMYLHARKLTNIKKNVSLLWVVLIAVAGYLIMGLMVIGVVKAVKSQGLLEKISQRYQQKNEMPITRVPSSCGVAIPHPTTTTGEADEQRKWYYEEHSLTADSFVVLDEDVHPRKFTLGAYMRYATEPFAANTTNFSTDVPTVLIKCTENKNKLTLDEFAALAAANKERTITLGKKGLFGEVQTVFVEVALPNSDQKERGFLAVSSDGNRLMYITSWSAEPDDADLEVTRKDADFIVANLLYREVPTELPEIQPQTSKTQPAKTGSTSSCKQLTISQGEFASNKCYTSSDYAELSNYINQFDTNAFYYNGAVAQANVTCNGFTESFKQQCEQAKSDMKKYEDAMNGFRVAINAVIARGK